MKALDAIYNRRAVKHFDPNHRISADEERQLLQATLQAPTSYNIQHWRFVLIKEPQLRQKIRAGFIADQSQFTDASLLVLFTADLKAWDNNPERYYADAPKEVSDMLVEMISDAYTGKEWLQRDEAQRSIGIAMQTMMLAAQGMGYESCPLMGFDSEQVAGLIDLPENHVMGPMVAIGKGLQKAHPKPGQLPLHEVVVENSF